MKADDVVSCLYTLVWIISNDGENTLLPGMSGVDPLSSRLRSRWISSEGTKYQRCLLPAT